LKALELLTAVHRY